MVPVVHSHNCLVLHVHIIVVGVNTFLPVTSERKERRMTYSEAVSKGNTRTDVSEKMQYGILHDRNNKQNNKITRVQSAHNNN